MKKVKTTELSLKFLLQNEEELPLEVGYLTFLFETKKRNFIKVILIDSKTLSEISRKNFWFDDMIPRRALNHSTRWQTDETEWKKLAWIHAEWNRTEAQFCIKTTFWYRYQNEEKRMQLYMYALSYENNLFLSKWE